MNSGQKDYGCAILSVNGMKLSSYRIALVVLRRLTYWWSNVVVLRESISQACEDTDVGSSGGEADADPTMSNDFQARAFRSQQLRKSKSDVSYLLSPNGAPKDWRTCGMFVATLFRIESWLHARVLESVWWQVCIVQVVFHSLTSHS